MLSLLFNLLVWKLRGPEHGLDFLTGYLIEYSLSVDNIFVFVLIFTYFRVRRMSQHRVLVWGILGALVMRGVMIFLGVALVARFHSILYLFGAFLLVTGFACSSARTRRKISGAASCYAHLPALAAGHAGFSREKFKARVDGRWMLTPLALVLIVIDIMDLVFAVDSIPAVFAITQDQFIIYTSNICAILGLRSLYFLLAHMIDRFIYLKTGLAFMLGFVGMKMIAAIPLSHPELAFAH